MKLLKSKLLFKNVANFTGKLLQNFKKMECEIFRILLKHVNGHLSVLFQFCITGALNHSHIHFIITYFVWSEIRSTGISTWISVRSHFERRLKKSRNRQSLPYIRESWVRMWNCWQTLFNIIDNELYIYLNYFRL